MMKSKDLWLSIEGARILLFRENSMLRLPASLHYADMFVKALGRNWKVSDELLKAGLLYIGRVKL